MIVWIWTNQLLSQKCVLISPALYIGVNKISCFRHLYLFSHPLTLWMCVHLVLSLRANSFYDVWWCTYCPYCVQITTALVLYNIRSFNTIMTWRSWLWIRTRDCASIACEQSSQYWMQILNRLRDITDRQLKPSCFSPSLLSMQLLYRIT